MADRFLTTALFTDIVNSTEKAGALGDGAWSDLLDLHDAFSRDFVVSSESHQWVRLDKERVCDSRFCVPRIRVGS
jgi:hypothetical protein